MNVPSGNDLPNDFNVVVEIPMQGDPVKYEVLVQKNFKYMLKILKQVK